MRSHVDAPHGSLLTGPRAAARQRRLKRLECFDRAVRASLPLAGTSAAHRAVYEQLMARFGVVMVGRHLERIAAILDRAEATAAIFVRPEPPFPAPPDCAGRPIATVRAAHLDAA